MVRAFGSHPRGHRFEPYCLHQKRNGTTSRCRSFFGAIYRVRTYVKEYRPCSARRGCLAREIFFVNSRPASSGFEPHAAKRHPARRLRVFRTRSREARAGRRSLFRRKPQKQSRGLTRQRQTYRKNFSVLRPCDFFTISKIQIVQLNEIY